MTQTELNELKQAVERVENILDDPHNYDILCRFSSRIFIRKIIDGVKELMEENEMWKSKK